MVVDILFSSVTFFISVLILLFTMVYYKNRSSSRYYLPPSPLSLPIIGHMHLIDTVPYRSFHKLSSQYGSLIYLRLGSVPCIIASSPDLAKEFLKNKELNFSSRPISRVINHVTYNSSGFAFAPYGPTWKFMKKVLMSQVLGGQVISKRQHIRRDEIDILVQLLMTKAKHGETVDVSHELMKLSNNIVTQMMLSIRRCGRTDQAEEVGKLIREVTEMFGQFNLSDSFGFLRNLDLQGFLKKAIDIRRRYDVVLERIMKEREEERKMKKHIKSDGLEDFLDILLDALEDEKSELKLSRENIKAFLLDIMTAGTDTSAASTEWALGELINHPHIYLKAREEIDSVVGKNRLVEESDLPNLPYLQTIFKETLRLHPPAPMLARESTQDCKIGGYDIPAKTRLFVNVWSINRNPKYWKDPLEFKPERFINSSGNEGVVKDVKGQNFDLLPFGTGRRGCPGIWLALVQVPAVLAAMIQCFDWKVIQEGNDNVVNMNERPGLTVPKANPLLLVPVARFDPFPKSGC